MRLGLSRRRLSGRRTAIAALAAAVVVVAGVAAGVAAASGNGAKIAAKSTTFTVRTGTVTVTTSASGTVEPVQSRALTFGTAGTVSTLAVKAGDTVTVGQTLATLDQSDAQSAVSSAESALTAATSNLSLAQEQATTPSPSAPSTGCVTGADYALAAPSASTSPPPSTAPSPRPSPSTSPSPAPSPTRSHRPTASPSPSSGGRGGSQCGSGSVSGSGSGATRSGSGSGATGGAGGAGSTGTDALLRAEQAVNNAELTLEQARAELAGTTIVAPSAGRVLSVDGSVGQNVSAGGSGFIVLAGVDSLAVEAEFSEADVANVAVGQPATVTLADHPGLTYEAKVTEIDPAGTTSSALVRYGVELDFTKAPSDLLLGQSAVAAVVTASAPNTLYVPSAALSNVQGSTATVTVRADGSDPTRTVGLGLAGGQGTQIISGLTAGDVVVVPAG
jgi:HlyD family secretion protein